MNPDLLLFGVALFCAAGVASWDLRRRRLRASLLFKAPALEILDVAAAAMWIFCVVRGAGLWIAQPETKDAAVLAVSLLGAALFFYLWSEGRRANQFQRPDGIVLGQALVLGGLLRLALRLFERESPVFDTASIGGILAGGILLAIIVPRFLKGKEEHRIIQRMTQQGETVQPEYTPPTPECPHPERWTMMDSMSAEVEVLEFLKQIVLTLKPGLIVETGTFIGLSAIRMAEGLQENGSGRLITCESDPVVYAKAKERIEASGVAKWINCRNESSFELSVDGAIDLFFSDSHLPIREEEIRRFLPQINPNGLILLHDTSSHYKVARESAFRLEQEGLISMVLVPTARGLMLAQKRAGRK